MISNLRPSDNVRHNADALFSLPHVYEIRFSKQKFPRNSNLNHYLIFILIEAR